MSSISVEDFDELIKTIFKMKDEIKQDSDAVKAKQEQLDALKAKVVASLKETDRSNFKSPYGLVSISEKWSVKLPQEDSDKALLFGHLKERGIFNKYATVNSIALNSLFMADWEAAQREGKGMEFSMPGIGQPTLFETLRMTKGEKS